MSVFLAHVAIFAASMVVGLLVTTIQRWQSARRFEIDLRKEFQLLAVRLSTFESRSFKPGRDTTFAEHTCIAQSALPRN